MINKLFSSNKIPQAMIIRQAPLSNFDTYLKEIMKGIICPNHGCGKCEWCQKIDENKFYDLYIFDGKEMKKQQVIDLITRCNKSGIESCNIRIYVIKNIEYASKSILNSLLKFVEEPPKGVYAIFTTRNYNAIIPTIRSRCFTIYLPKNDQSVDEFLNTKDISSQNKQLIKKCFYDLDTLKNEYDKFIKYLDLINKLSSVGGLNFANEGLNLFRKMEYSDINLFLEICKNSFSEITPQVIEIQDNLYLNSPKVLIYNQIYDLLAGIRK